MGISRVLFAGPATVLAVLAGCGGGSGGSTSAVNPNAKEHSPAGMAVHVVYESSSKANAVTGKRSQQTVERYLFFHHGREVVLTLAGPRGADNVDPWRTVSGSLRWTA